MSSRIRPPTPLGFVALAQGIAGMILSLALIAAFAGFVSESPVLAILLGGFVFAAFLTVLARLAVAFAILRGYTWFRPLAYFVAGLGALSVAGSLFSYMLQPAFVMPTEGFEGIEIEPMPLWTFFPGFVLGALDLATFVILSLPTTRAYVAALQERARRTA